MALGPLVHVENLFAHLCYSRRHTELLHEPDPRGTPDPSAGNGGSGWSAAAPKPRSNRHPALGESRGMISPITSPATAGISDFRKGGIDIHFLERL